MNNQLYWVWFSQIFGICSARADQILSVISSPQMLYNMSIDELKSLKLFTNGEIIKITQTSLDNSQTILNRVNSLGGYILTQDMPQYPTRLKNIYAPPIVLYCLGDLPPVDNNLTIGMVGSRNPTDYGQVSAAYIAKGLAMAGAVIISGLADGIDAISHTTAIDNGGKTIAVIGSGIDIIYPMVNKELWHRIYNGNGAIISEYLPGTPAKGQYFPIRNRIISALSAGVCVVEAEARSGSLITAGHALTQDRDVFAVPGSIFSKFSAGTNKLIKQGAKPVTHPNDILEEYALTCNYKIEPDLYVEIKVDHNILENIDKQDTIVETNTKPTKTPPAYLSANQLTVYNQLLLGAKTPDELALITQMPIHIILSALTELEIFGAVKSLSGRKFSIA